MLASMLMLGSCGIDPEAANPDIRQVDMTVIIPIHPSSLEYFDYAVRYSDNMGQDYDDVVSQAGNGDYYQRTFSYRSLPVMCSVTVEMVPKEGCTSVGPCAIYPPKPYIYPNVFTSHSSTGRGTPDRDMEGVEPIMIDEMPFETFKSTYGTTFSTHGMVKDSPTGYDTTVY